MKPPVPYFGGKSRLAPWIVSHFGPHQVYVEPFCGSASVLLAKNSSGLEVVNDADGALVNFFRVLRDQPDDLARVCSLTPYARDEFMACRSVSVDAEPLERARQWFCLVTQGFGSMPVETTGWSAPSLNGGNEAAKVSNLIRRFEAVAVRLRNVTIENRDAFAVMAAYDSPDTLHYLDPPYLWSTRSWAKVQSRKQDYAVEFQTDAEHQRLVDYLKSLKGHVVLSGYDCDLYRDALEGSWHVIRKDVAVAGRSRLDGGTSRAVEVLWVNRFPGQQNRLFAV